MNTLNERGPYLNLTLEFPRDPDFSLAFKPPGKIQHSWLLCRIDHCEYIYRTRIDCRMLTTVKCARDWQWLYLILQMNTTHNFFLAVDGDVPFLFRSFLKGVFWLGWVNEWMNEWNGWVCGCRSNGRWGCRITDAGLLQISLANSCPNLTSISLWGVTAITDDGVVQLVKFSINNSPSHSFFCCYICLWWKKPQVSGLLAHNPEKSS